jgi:hypothetical protein
MLAKSLRQFTGVLFFATLSLQASGAFAQSWADRVSKAESDLNDSRRSMNQSVQRFSRTLGVPSPLKPSENTDFAPSPGNGTLKALVMTPAELEVFKARQEDWKARCQPTVKEDSEGLRRVTYAQPNCDLSSYNSAGE